MLSFEGLGEFRLGDTDIPARGAMELEPECGLYVPTADYLQRGISFALQPTGEADEPSPLAHISIFAPADGSEPVRTEAGALPGMTYGEVTEVPPEAGDTSKNGDGGPFQTLHVREGDTEMVFLSEEYGTALFEDAQTVETISLRPFSEDSRGSC